MCLPLLREMRGSLQRVEGKLDELVRRVSSVETNLAHVHVELAGIHVDLAGHSARMDRIDGRLDRIEKRARSRRRLTLIAVGRHGSGTLPAMNEISPPASTAASTLILASPKPTRRPLTGAASR